MPTIDVPLGPLTFEVDVAGDPNAPLVLLLHGFPQTSHAYRHALPALASAGFYAVAPNQRGYSPRARPPRVEEYAAEALIEDAIGIAAHFGAERFHLVGHDWGGQLAWLIAARQPNRVRTLAVLSRPHPGAFAQSFTRDATQAHRSRHHRAFQDPGTAARMLEDGARRFRRVLADQGVEPRDIDAYLQRLGDRAALDAALHWYRAAISGSDAGTGPAAEVPAITVPTLYVWGEADATVGRAAAEATAGYVAAPYRFVPIAGAGHFLTDQVGEQVTRELLAHLTQSASA